MTVTVAVCDVAWNVAARVTVVCAATEVVVTFSVADVEPTGMETLAGIGTAGLDEDSVMEVPAAAGPLSVIVTVTGLPPNRVCGVVVSAVTCGARTPSEALACDCP